MPVVVCSACAKNLNIDERNVGGRVDCPRCGATVLIPTNDLPTNPLIIRADSPDEIARRDVAAKNEPDLTGILRPAVGADELGRLGAFRILKILGSGGMGVVFQAEDIKLKRKVAVKAMLPSAMRDIQAGQRFLREAEAMAKVEHPHVARIYQVDEDRGISFLAMEFLRGEPLDERLRREQILPTDEALRISREIAEGLAAAHELGLVHRDIKPANVWLESPNAFVKILDFGLARPERPEQSVTESGVVVGTPAFMAPEQARGGNVDARTDLFSLGVVLYRMTTGQMPFTGADAIATMVAVASEKPTSPRVLNPNIPAELESITLKLLEKLPKDRFQSATETARAIAGIDAVVPNSISSRTIRPVKSPEGKSRWKPLGMFLAGLAATAACFAAWQLFLREANLAPVKAVDRVVDKPREKPKQNAQSLSIAEMLTSTDYEWTPPENLGPRINAGIRNLAASLTGDERQIVYSRDKKLWIGKRNNPDEPFENVELLPDSVNEKIYEISFLSSDGLLLVFGSDFRGNADERENIWMSSRPSVDVPFGPPKCLPEPVNSTHVERTPVLSPDGLTLLLTVMNRPGFNNGDIISISRKSRDEQFANPTALTGGLNTPSYDVPDWISADGRVVFATKMEGKPPFETYFYIRPSVDAPFGAAQDFGPPLSQGKLGRPWLSPDGKRIYFHARGIPGSHGDLDLWMSRRVPKR